MNGSERSLLIVDDDERLREGLSAIFGKLGYRVCTAADGFAALELMRHELPDVLLSDLNMPGMSGFELLSVVRRRLPALRVVAMSGAFAGEGFQPGVAADAFYEKAGELPILLQLIQTLPEVKRPINFQQETATAPLWISASDSDVDKTGAIIIPCPECFRTFQYPLSKSDEVIFATACVFCDVSIHFAVVQSKDSALPSSIQRKIRRPAADA